MQNPLKLLPYALITAVAAAQTLNTSQSTYTAGQPVQANWTGASSVSDWIGIYPQGVIPGGPASTNWAYLSGTHTKPAAVIPSGSVAMSSSLAPGNYSIYLCANDGYAVRASNTFTVVPVGPALTAPSVIAGDLLTVNFQGAPGNATDWIGVYQPGQSGSNELQWTYLNGLTSGTVQFSGLAAGNYDLYLYANDGYQVVAQGSTSVLANALSTPSPVYSDNENKGFSYQFTDTQNNHWLGVYAEGAANANYVTTLDLGGADSGSGAVIQSLAPGRYDLRAFKAGTYDKVGEVKILVRDDHRQSNWVSLPSRNQTHTVGALDTINGYADPVWKVAANLTGVASSTTAPRMKAGNYTGMVQILHPQTKLKQLCKLQALVNGQLVAEKTLYSHPIADHGAFDCLYESLPFTVATEGDVTLRVSAIGNAAFSTGAMSIFYTTQQRPVHVISHRENNIKRVNAAVASGATGVEIDISTVNIGGQLKIEGHHHSTEVDWTPYNQFGALLDTVKGHLTNGTLSVVYFDIKDPQSFDQNPPAGHTYTQYATELYTLLQARGFDPSQVVVGTFEPVAFRNAAQSMNYPVTIDSYYWGGGRFAGWIKDAELYSTLQEFGSPDDSPTGFCELSEAVYKNGRIKNYYVWTFYNDPAYYDNTTSTYSGEYSKTLARRSLILGANGLMPDDSAPMKAVLTEPAFSGAFRAAASTDRVGHLHGEN